MDCLFPCKKNHEVTLGASQSFHRPGWKELSPRMKKLQERWEVLHACQQVFTIVLQTDMWLLWCFVGSLRLFSSNSAAHSLRMSMKVYGLTTFAIMWVVIICPYISVAKRIFKKINLHVYFSPASPRCGPYISSRKSETLVICVTTLGSIPSTQFANHKLLTASLPDWVSENLRTTF